MSETETSKPKRGRGRPPKNTDKGKAKTNDTSTEKEVSPVTHYGIVTEAHTSNFINNNNISKDTNNLSINKEFKADSYTNISSIIQDDLAFQEKRLEESESKFVITGDELIKRNLEKIPCLIEPIFQQVGLAAIAGSSDTGKSSLLRDLAIAVCAKQDQYLGWKICAEHHSAIYVSTEDDEQSISYLLNKQNADKKLSENNFSSLRYIFDTADLLEKLEEELARIPADLVIIDAFSDLYGGSLNDANQVRCFLNKYSQLAQKHKCLIIFLHHTGKRTDELSPSKHNLLGSQGFEAKMRVVVELRTDKSDTSKRHFCIVKGNYLTTEQKEQSYILQFTENMTFHSTGERVPLDSLSQSDDQFIKYQEAKKLKEQGMTLEQVAHKMGYANKSSVSKLLKKYDVTDKLPQATQETSTEQPDKEKL